jgi:hypothetical protein
MTYQGTVQNGVILVEGGVKLPDGAELRIEVIDEGNSKSPPSDRSEPTIGQKLAALGRWAESQPCDLPDDLAENHDHYHHGVPKRS